MFVSKKHKSPLPKVVTGRNSFILLQLFRNINSKQWINSAALNIICKYMYNDIIHI